VVVSVQLDKSMELVADRCRVPPRPMRLYGMGRETRVEWSNRPMAPIPDMPPFYKERAAAVSNTHRDNT
jgi:hypothetical protein